MVKFNPYNIIMLLYVSFTVLNLPSSPITSGEQKIICKIEGMLQETPDKKYEIEKELSLDYQNKLNYLMKSTKRKNIQ